MPAPLVLLAVGAAVPLVGGAGGYVYSVFRKRKSQFPSSTVYKALKESYSGNSPLTQNQIEDYWSWYLKGVVEKRLKAFDVRDNPTALKPAQQPIVTYMVQNLRAPQWKVRAFCLAIQMLVTKGAIRREFWDPLSSDVAKRAVSDWNMNRVDVSQFDNDPISDLAGGVKWIGLGLISLVVASAAAGFMRTQKALRGGS